MRFLNFSSRNRKEILRDPLSLVFGIGFPVIMLALFSVLSNSIQGMPKEIFSISNFAPDMVVFGQHCRQVQGWPSTCVSA